MKKFLSLLLALSLLLSMSAVAIATTGGELVDGENTIELPWDSKEASVYTYTATQTGTLYISTAAFFSAIGDYDYFENDENMEEWEWYTELTVDGQKLEGLYFGSVEVVEGQTYTFSWSHLPEMLEAKWYKMGWKAVIDLSYSGEAVPQPGSETLPVELYTEDCPTDSIEIAPGATAYYLLYDFGGACFTVEGENAYVVTESFNMELGETVVERYNAENGVVTVPVENYYVTIQIGNAGNDSAVFALNYYYPLGSRENPAPLEMGENVAQTVRENYDGYYFTFTAQCDGMLTLTFPPEGWMYGVTNADYSLNLFYTYDYEGAENPLVLEVSKGDVLTVNVNSFNGALVPGGDVIFTAEATYNHNYVDGVCEHCGDREAQFVKGDANGDGNVNARDARLMLRFAAQMIGAEELDTLAADLNGDGKVNARDARMALRIAAKLD